MKKCVYRAAICCGLYWAVLWLQLLLLEHMTESWMIPAIFMLLSTRVMLWLSPPALTAMVWISGRRKPECPVRFIVPVNIAALAINCLSFLGFYRLTGSWY